MLKTLAITAILFSTPVLADGEKEFKKCAACHTIAEGGKNGTGPNLWNIFNRGVAQGEFKYSKGFAEWAQTNTVWTPELMNEWLTDPKKLVKGTKMQYKEKDEAARANLIAYLQSMGVQ
jgi:cytochrome c